MLLNISPEKLQSFKDKMVHQVQLSDKEKEIEELKQKQRQEAIKLRLKNGLEKKMFQIQSDEMRKQQEEKERKLKFQMKLKDGFTKKVHQQMADEQKQMRKEMIKLKLENKRRRSQVEEQTRMQGSANYREPYTAVVPSPTYSQNSFNSFTLAVASSPKKHMSKFGSGEGKETRDLFDKLGTFVNSGPFIHS
jgi:hypothetical protein